MKKTKENCTKNVSLLLVLLKDLWCMQTFRFEFVVDE